MKFKTAYNSRDIIEKGESSAEPSMTVPDQTFTVRELIDRNNRGLTLTQGKVPIYNGEDNYFPDLEKLDLAEREQFLRQTKDTIQTAKEKLAKGKAKFEETQMYNRFKQQLEKEQADKANKTDTGLTPTESL